MDRSLYCFPLLFKVYQGLVPFVAEGYIAFPYCLRFTRGLIPFAADGYIAFHYCLRFTTGPTKGISPLANIKQ
jgi:hypothetical protein